MDCLSEIIYEYFLDKIDQINELLEDSNIGYVLNYDSYDGAIWGIRDEVESRSETLNETLEELAFTYDNTIQHIHQAKEQLTRIDNDRARKDALRDSVSALESYLKYLTGCKDLRSSVNYLVDNDIGAKKILRDAISIWTYVHDDIPDIRHGHSEQTYISEEEVLYWIDRIMSLIKYLSRTTS